MPKRHKTNRKSNPGVRDSDHALFPACDGKPWRNYPPSDPQRTLKRQFLRAYFRINQAYARLVALRKKLGAAVPHTLERPILLEIERTLVAREKLEDRHASRGVVAAPIYRGGFTVDVRFADAHTARRQGGAIIISSASVRITIPLPAALRAKLCKN